MIKKPTLWIDVTMLVNWSGRMTGIQRVEYNIAKRYANQDNVKFCVFDKKTESFLDFDFAHIEYKINHQQEVSIEKELQSSKKGGSIKMRLKRSLPSPVKQILKKSYNNLRSIDSSVEKNMKTFDVGDTLLILSGDWSDHTFANLVRKNKQDLSINVIQIVYDMLPVLFPGYFVLGMPKQFADYMEKILPIADMVLAISESTKRDIESFMQRHRIPFVPIRVFRLGDDFVKVKAKYPESSDLKGKTYTLTVCTIEARKNHLELFFAMREAIMQDYEVPFMVFAGKKGWLTDDLYYMIKNDPVISKKIIFIEQPTDSELAWLYENCLFTIFPSFYEGWGLPVAESLFYGKFCLSSNASSMPEIGGDLVDYFSPSDPMEALKKIRYYFDNRNVLTKKEQLIAERYKTSTWDLAYEQVYNAVKEVYSDSLN